MTENQQAAYVITQAACAMIRAMGMQADNSQHPEDQPHTKEDFDALIVEYDINYNAVIGEFRR